MQHAIYAPTLKEYADPKRLVELAIAAERAGFDGFFIWDVLFMEPGAATADSTVALGAIAQATSKIRIGTMITPLARRLRWGKKPPQMGQPFVPGSCPGSPSGRSTRRSCPGDSLAGGRSRKGFSSV